MAGMPAIKQMRQAPSGRISCLAVRPPGVADSLSDSATVITIVRAPAGALSRRAFLRESRLVAVDGLSWTLAARKQCESPSKVPKSARQAGVAKARLLAATSCFTVRGGRSTCPASYAIGPSKAAAGLFSYTDTKS